MKLTKIHCAFKFKQSPWLAKYINYNNEKRKEAVKNNNDAEKDMRKLLNNSTFGKTMENLRKRVNIEIINSRKIALKRIAKPNFKRSKIFRQNLIGIHSVKSSLLLNRPIDVGFTVL